MPDSGCLTGSWEYGDCMMYFDARAAAATTGMHLHCVATKSLDEQREIIAAVLKLWLTFKTFSNSCPIPVAMNSCDFSTQLLIWD